MTPGIRKVLAALFLVLTSASTAGADEASEPISGLLIEDAMITTAPAGAAAEARLRIENLSGRTLALVGASADWAGSSAVVLDDGSGSAQPITALAIGENEVLDLRSSHIWIEFRDLREPIAEGTRMTFHLIFTNGSAPVTAHAHRRKPPRP